MSKKISKRATFAAFAAILMASMLVCSIPAIVTASNAPAGSMGKILIDYSHGQYKASVAYLDDYLRDNLTALGFEVVYVWGGLNDSILTDADGVILSNVWDIGNEFLASEVTALGDWFNAGNKFLWVGGESDFVEASGGQWVLDNMTWVLETVDSHVYLEPTAVQDPDSYSGAPYRPVANITTDNQDIAAIVEGVDKVLIHSPTCLYGSDSDTPGINVNAVALESTPITDVYPLLYYFNGTIVDSDLTAPYAHTNGQYGQFAAVSLELHAGAAGSGAIVVSGGSPYGHYWPMVESEYAGVTGMTGMAFVVNTISYGMLHAMTEQGEGTILIDYSHGQYKASAYHVDQRIWTSLFLMGYELTEVWGGLNSTILATADGLLLNKVWDIGNEFLASEVAAIGTWFNAGNKFMLVGGESDFVEASGGQWVLDNMTWVLETVGSHVYMEPTAVQDPDSYAGAPYRPVANITGSDPFVASIVNGVGKVLVHSPTCLYGSDSDTPGENVNAVALESASITDVYPLLYYFNGTIVDSDLTAPYVHTNGEYGHFVAMTLEVNAGAAGNGALVVTGGNPYGHYWSMAESTYAGVTEMTGLYLLRQAIDFGMKNAAPEPVTSSTTTTTTTPGTTTPSTTPPPPGPIDPLLLAAVGIGAVVVILLIVVVMRRR
jgi:hypothetical protein